MKIQNWTSSSLRITEQAEGKGVEVGDFRMYAKIGFNCRS